MQKIDENGEIEKIDEIEKISAAFQVKMKHICNIVTKTKKVKK